MGWDYDHKDPWSHEEHDQDDNLNNCGGASYYFLYGGGIFVMVLLVLVLLKLYYKLWVYCIEKRRLKSGRVVTQPQQQQQPVKAIPLPYTADCPPPYQACVSGNPHPQQFGGTKQQMPVSGPNSASNASAPPKYSSPTPTHVVNIPENRTRY